MSSLFSAVLPNIFFKLNYFYKQNKKHYSLYDLCSYISSKFLNTKTYFFITRSMYSFNHQKSCSCKKQFFLCHFSCNFLGLSANFRYFFKNLINFSRKSMISTACNLQKTVFTNMTCLKIKIEKSTIFLFLVYYNQKFKTVFQIFYLFKIIILTNH